MPDLHPLAPLPDELRLRDLEARDETRGELVPTFTVDESGLDALNNLDAHAPEPARRAADVRWAGKAEPGGPLQTITDDPVAGPSGELHVDPALNEGEAEQAHGTAPRWPWEDSGATFTQLLAMAYLCLRAAVKKAPTVLLSAETAAVASRIGPLPLMKAVERLMRDGAEYEPLQPDGAA